MKKFLALICLCTQLEATVASIKGIGMGGAAVSYPLDSGCIAYNPAGIVNLCNRVDVGLYNVFNYGSTKVRGNLNPALNRTDNNTRIWAYSPEIGMVYHLTPTVAAGFSVYNEKDLRVRYTHNFPLLGTTPVGFEYILEIVAPTVAAKFFDHHAVSVTLNYMVQRFRLKGLEHLELFSKFPNFVTNRGYNYSQGAAVTLGYQGDFFNDKVRVGFAWRSKGIMNKFSKYKGFVAQGGTFDIPEVFRAGISFSPVCQWTFAFDYQLIHYAQTRALNNPFQLFSPNLLGSNEGSGFGWTNQSYYRVGINYDFSRDLALRVGFRHANENFKGINVAPNLLTLDTTIDFLTMGGTYLITENMEINALGAYGFNQKAKGPLPELFGGGTIELQQQTYVGTLGVGYYF